MVFSVLYHILIRPIEYLIEVFFWLMFDFFESVPAAIISVSVLVSVLTLPLYLRADAVQEAERRKQKEMEPWIRHIRNVFSGDERLMTINAYYREAGYRPLYALRGILPLFLQIPFFIAAYRYLSGLKLLQGCSFLGIKDLGNPDALLAFGGVQIHLLPVLMTVINCISGLVYTEKGDHKQRLQIFGLAVVFLILLYPSPSGMVLYWTMNNVFSLCKNLICKYVKEPGRIAVFAPAVFAMLLVLFLLISGKWNTVCREKDYEAMLLYFLILMGLFLPLFLDVLKKKGKTIRVPEVGTSEIIILQASLSVLMGAVIPLSVVSSSPADFVNLYHYISPLHYVFTTLCVSAGLFLAWGGVILYVCPARARSIYYLGLLYLLIASLADFLVFKPPVGMITRELCFDRSPDYERLPRVLNMLLLMGLFALCILLWKKTVKLRKNAAVLLLLAFSGMSVIYAAETVIELTRIRSEWSGAQEDPYLHLSKTEKNVVVIMLDRMMGVYLPFIMEERPELKEQFDGFTYYPNTVSTGRNTNAGSPGLYGGYDYTVRALNERSELSLKEKQNEALMVLPRLFADEGYKCVTWDPPYANYRMPSDLSVFEEDTRITALPMEGRFQMGFGQEAYTEQVERNFFFYSIFRVAPTLCQDEIYAHGAYMATDPPAANHAFFDAYAELDHLPELTLAEDDASGFFLIADNNTTHETMLLQLPDYTVPEHVDNSAFPDMGEDRVLNGMTLHFDPEEPEKSLGQYHTDVAAMMALGRWFDDLRQKGVYDNTRIILVSDHGDALGQFDDMIFEDGIDTQTVNAFLCVKDFNAKGFTTDTTFMTNCDTPALALSGIVQDPVNPYTGNPIDMSGKEGGIDVFWGHEGNIYENNGNLMEPVSDRWYHVDGNIYDRNSWSEPFYMDWE